MHAEPKQPLGFLTRISLAAAFAAHLAVAGFYGWLSPKGFSVDHSRFWLNTILPITVVLVALFGLWSMLCNQKSNVVLVAVAFASAWLGGIIAGRLFFPVSLLRFWELGLLVPLCGYGYAWLLMHDQKGMVLRAGAVLLASLIAGVFAAWAQIPPVPSTQPINEIPAIANQDWQTADSTARISLGKNAYFYPNDASLRIKHKGIQFECSPLLNFDRVSPDGFWSLLAPPHNTAQRHLSDQLQQAQNHWLRYSDSSLVRLPVADAKQPISWTTWSTLSADTYSHLNSFCTLLIDGHKNLSLSFSPCPTARIEVLPADYPTGRPARFAYVTEQQEFNVVEATSGEKGPFHTLARGKFPLGTPLSIDFYDADERVATLELHDWSKQLSTNISPSAGWQVPMNAIEFQRLGNPQNATVAIHITLAATSVGRGWETVGHRAGTYRNQMIFLRVERSLQR